MKGRRTPLQQDLDRVSHLLARAALVVVALIVALGLLRGQALGDWAVIAAMALTISPVLELGKWAERRGWFGRLSSDGAYAAPSTRLT